MMEDVHVHVVVLKLHSHLVSESMSLHILSVMELSLCIVPVCLWVGIYVGGC